MIMKVEIYYFPIDFIIVDMKVVEKLSHMPIILGRPFLATTQATTKWGKGTMELKVGQKKVEI